MRPMSDTGVLPILFSFHEKKFFGTYRCVGVGLLLFALDFLVFPLGSCLYFIQMAFVFTI